MTSRATTLFLLGGTAFLVATVLLLLWIEGQERGMLRWGLVLAALGVAFLAWGGLRRRSESRNPLDLRREQKLWRSGPLGRRWLKVRKRLF